MARLCQNELCDLCYWYRFLVMLGADEDLPEWVRLSLSEEVSIKKR